MHEYEALSASFVFVFFLKSLCSILKQQTNLLTISIDSSCRALTFWIEHLLLCIAFTSGRKPIVKLPRKKKSALIWNALCLAFVGLHIPVKVSERRGHLEETGGPQCCWGWSANSDKCLSYYDTGAEPWILHVHSWGRRRLILPLYSATWQTSSGWWEY